MSLKEDKSRNILLIGIGNPLRCDDGVGAYVAECIEAKGLKGITVWISQQLQVEDLERMLNFSQIILVDASLSGPPFEFRAVQKHTGQILSSSHHLSAETFVNLAKSLYHKDLNIGLCSIRGISFEVGNRISADVLKEANQAVEFLCNSQLRQAHA